jgi:cytoskeleton protein RodZ
MRDDDDQQVQPADGELREAVPRLLGDTLATARSAHALSVQQLAAELRVEPALLLALEGERFSELGPAVFVKGYLKQYAQRLGLDYADLLRRYEQAADVEEMPIVHRSGTRWQEGRRGTRALVVIAAVALVSAGSWMLWTSGAVEDLLSRAANGDVDETANVAASASAPAAAPAGVQPARPAGTVGRDAPATAVLPDLVSEARDASEFRDARDSDAQDGVLQAESVDAVSVSAAFAETAPETGQPPQSDAVGGDLPDGTTAAEPPGPAAPIPESHTVIVLSVSDDCWVEINDAAGDRVFYGLARAGQTLTLDGRAPLSFVLGNASSVALQIDGQPYPLPADDVIGNIARFTIAGRDGSSRQ